MTELPHIRIAKGFVEMATQDGVTRHFSNLISFLCSAFTKDELIDILNEGIVEDFFECRKKILSESSSLAYSHYDGLEFIRNKLAKIGKEIPQELNDEIERNVINILESLSDDKFQDFVDSLMNNSTLDEKNIFGVDYFKVISNWMPSLHDTLYRSVVDFVKKNLAIELNKPASVKHNARQYSSVFKYLDKIAQTWDESISLPLVVEVCDYCTGSIHFYENMLYDNYEVKYLFKDAESYGVTPLSKIGKGLILKGFVHTMNRLEIAKIRRIFSFIWNNERANPKRVRGYAYDSDLLIDWEHYIGEAASPRLKKFWMEIDMEIAGGGEFPK